MKQGLLRITLVSCLLITSLFWGGAVYAQDEELPDPGLTPDSPFYFLDTWGKNISMFFTFGDEAKAKKALHYAEERLSEAQAMAVKNKIREMTRAANDYDGFMAMVNEKLEAAAENGTSDNVSERLAELAYRIHTRFSELRDKLPPKETANVTPADEETREEATATEEARATIERAKVATINSQIKALRRLVKNKAERAFDISSETIERLMEKVRARVRVSANVTDDVNEALDYAARIAELEDEMTAIAEEKGIDITAIQERLAQSTINRLEVLSEVYENAPEAAQRGIENAIENSVEKYERVVEKLKERNVSGEISVNATTLQNIPEKIRERLNLTTSNQAQIANEPSVSAIAPVSTQTENQEQNQNQLSNSETAASANQTIKHQETENQEKNKSYNN